MTVLNYRLPKIGRPIRRSHAARVQDVVARAKRIPAIVQWSFLLFIFTIPFELSKLPFTSGRFSLAKLTGLLFFACCLFYQKECIPRIPNAIKWFLAFVFIYLLNTLFVPKALGSLITLIMLMTLSWISSGLLRDKNIAKRVLVTYSLATSIFAIAMVLRISAFSGNVENAVGTRATGMGGDPNDLALTLGVGVVILIGMLVNRIIRNRRYIMFAVGLTLPLLAAIVATSSRTGVAAVIVGISVYVLPLVRGKGKKATIILAIFGAVALVYMVIHDPVSSARWDQTFSEGQVSGREGISQIAIEMILEQPILGWQPYKFQREIGKRMGLSRMKSSHNLFLWLFLTVGILGAFPFLVGVWLCFRAAWAGREGDFGSIPLAAFITVMAGNMALDWISRKPMWIVIAFALASMPRRLPTNAPFQISLK